MNVQSYLLGLVNKEKGGKQKAPRKKPIHHEFNNIHKPLCRFISIEYPDIFFLSDTIAAVKLNVKQASRNAEIQKKGFKCPDVIIFEKSGHYCGLFMELKAKSPYLKNGELSKKEHIQGQWDTILKLREKGYDADFYWDLEVAKEKVRQYLDKHNNSL